MPSVKILRVANFRDLIIGLSVIEYTGNESGASFVGDSMLLRIMLGAFFIVNASAGELPPLSKAAKNGPKDSAITLTKIEMSRLADLLMKTGQDGKIPERMALDLGLPGARPGKGVVIKDTSFVLVYEESPDTAKEGKHPVCFLLNKNRRSGLDTELKFYRVNLDGQLERVYFQQGKVDKEGRPVPGSAVPFYPDINSPAVKKAFADEIREIRAWLKQQKKPASKTAKPAAP